MLKIIRLDVPQLLSMALAVVALLHRSMVRHSAISTPAFPVKFSNFSLSPPSSKGFNLKNKGIRKVGVSQVRIKLTKNIIRPVASHHSAGRFPIIQ